MRTHIIYSFLILVFGGNIASAQQGILFSDGSLNAILSIAQDRNKNVFIDTYADWCQPCKRMEKKFKDKDVARFFNEHFINYRVNMQNPIKANQLRRRYDIVFLPTMLIVDPNGIVKSQVDRELTTSELLNMGQKALDPSYYHISEATAVRKNTNEAVVVAQESKSKPVKKAQENVTSPNKSVQIASSTGSLSEATKRSNILDSYETVGESSQKILVVLDAGELPPEVLMQEAYLRLEFMDGSHKQAAKNYLATQENWDSETNRQFIHDFVNNAASPEYEFIIANKEKFNQQFGKESVKKTLEIITYRALHNSVPRPSLEESIKLYEDLGVKEPTRQGNNYFISRLILENDINEVLLIGNQYLSINPQDHEILYTIGRFLTYRKNRTFDNLLKASEFMESAIEINPESLIYLDLLGDIYTKQDKSNNAKRIYYKAIQLAKKQGKDSKIYEDKSTVLNG